MAAAMLGRRLIVAVPLVVTFATTAGCTSSARSDGPAEAVATSTAAPVGSFTANSSSDSPASNRPQRLSAADRVLALAAAHQDANQIAVGRDSQQVSGWPSGISAVTAVVQPGTVTDSNTGHRCESGTIIAVRLVGAFDTVIGGTPTSTGTSSPDTTVREIDLSVDGSTGLICLISVRTEPLRLGSGESILYSR